MGVGLRPGAKAPDKPPTPYRLRASPRLYLTSGQPPHRPDRPAGTSERSPKPESARGERRGPGLPVRLRTARQP